jgi:cation:H+ antiporter
MILFSAAVLAGIVVLAKSADVFVGGAAGVARHFGVSALLVGMLIVGFGTSAPEMLVSGLSAAQGAPGIALGNAWGSNVANIALILGVAAVVKPLAVRSRILRREIPVLLAATAVAGALVLDRTVSRLDAGLLLVAFAAFLVWSIVFGRRQVAGSTTENPVTADTATVDPLAAEFAASPATSSRDRGLGRSLAELAVGLVFLLVGSRAVVWGAVGIAGSLGLSELVIGLTIVAVGTSLPELASSVAAARRGEDEIAVGNVIGSNLFNTAAVVGIAGLIQPIPLQAEALLRDYPVMLALTVLLLLVGFARRGRPGRITRAEGVLLLLLYTGYVTSVAVSAAL